MFTLAIYYEFPFSRGAWKKMLVVAVFMFELTLFQIFGPGNYRYYDIL